MPTSNEYGKLAEKCFRLAGEANTETDRQACLDLAQKWLEAASRQGEIIPEQIAGTEKLERERIPKSEKPRSQSSLGWRQRLLGLFRWDRLQR